MKSVLEGDLQEPLQDPMINKGSGQRESPPLPLALSITDHKGRFKKYSCRMKHCNLISFLKNALTNRLFNVVKLFSTVTNLLSF